MKYVEITVRTTSQAADIVAALFFELGSAGVSISDKNDLQELLKSGFVWDYVDEDIGDLFDEEHVLVRGFVAKAAQKAMLSKLNLRLLQLKEDSYNIIEVGSLEVQLREFDNADFVNAWKEHFKPIFIKDIIICPKWLKAPAADSNFKTVFIDPGMAFGTGEHETTSLCIELMQNIDLKEKIVADIGCGSGILGLCALKLGAAHAYLSDFDASAVAAAKNNAGYNKLLDKCSITQSDLLENADFSVSAVFINIVAEVLNVLAPNLNKILAEGAQVILSGIIESRLDSVIKTYSDCGYKLLQQTHKDEWYALRLCHA